MSIENYIECMFKDDATKLSLSLVFQVNQDNVVKVGHRQVVNMIRQGGNHLVIKVVTVSRNLDPEDTARKKGKPVAWSHAGFPHILMPSLVQWKGRRTAAFLYPPALFILLSIAAHWGRLNDHLISWDTGAVPGPHASHLAHFMGMVMTQMRDKSCAWLAVFPECLGWDPSVKEQGGFGGKAWLLLGGNLLEPLPELLMPACASSPCQHSLLGAGPRLAGVQLGPSSLSRKLTGPSILNTSVPSLRCYRPLVALGLGGAKLIILNMA